MTTEQRLGRQQLLGVFFTSVGSLAFEVVLTRIFSVKMWYHFAFLSISLALMGSAAAGVVLYLLPKLARPETAKRSVGWLAIFYALSVPLTFVLYQAIPFQPVLMNRDSWVSGPQLFWLLLIYLVLAIPFFMSGLVLSLALTIWAKQAGRIYWADLMGAALGCLLSIAALQAVGGASAVLVLSVVMALAGVAFTNAWVPRRPQQIVAVGALLLLSALTVTNIAHPWLRITVNKAGGAESPPEYERWNAHSRVTVYESSGYPFFWAVNPAHWQETVDGNYTFHHRLLLIDGVAGTPIQNFDGDLRHVAFLRNDLTSLVYHLINQPRTLVIGPGGGRDVLAALATDAPHVTAVEVNPAVIDAVRGPFAEYADHLYDRPDVSVVVADARGYIDRSPDRYDVIQASLIDTWAAGGSGAFALSENSLYTQEAFETYYDHLTDRGYLTVSRWYLPSRPAETLRLVSTAMAGLSAAGVADPRQHVAVVALDTSGAQTEGLSTALFKRAPFTPAEVEGLASTVEELGFSLIYAPGLTPFEEVGTFIVAEDHAAYIRSYPLDISPATDDRPFFFNLVLLGDLLDPSLSASGVCRTSMEAIAILGAVIGISLTFGVLIILLLLWFSHRRSGLVRPSGALLGYFSVLGLAFMIVEIPTIQKLTVYLGRPVYSLAIVLFSLLVSSSLGSLWSCNWPVDAVPRYTRRFFPVMVAILLVHPFLSVGILQATLGFALWLRIAIAVFLLLVLGFMMGVPFPTGVRWAGTHRPGVVPWLWGVNGVMSVLGSAAATAAAIHMGFRWTLIVAALLYGIAGLLFAVELRRSV
ncbi:MAG: hypothetical protein MUF84_06305 [Anaerolineae bacterium]|nr:hypothetical protein [Anaerolineae bacterium]